MKKGFRNLALAGTILASAQNLPTNNNYSGDIINDVKSSSFSILQKNNSPIEENTKIYKIEKGDNISYLAEKFNLTQEELEILVKITKSNKKVTYLIAGETIRVPISIYHSKKLKPYINEEKEKSKTEKLNKLHNSGDEKKLLEKIDYNLFPENTQSLGMNRIVHGLLGDMKTKFNPNYPLFVDKLWENEVNCAGTMRAVFGYSTSLNDKTSEELNYINTQNIDAWMLPEVFIKKLGFSQIYNLMGYFDKTKIGRLNILKKGQEENYKNKILEIGQYLEKDGKVGTLIPIYFTFSNYKKIVKNHNKGKKIEDLHINTHQALYIGNGEKEFKANKVPNIRKGKKILDWNNLDIINYFTNFVQERGGLKYFLYTGTKKTIIENLKYFHPLIKIQVNGKTIDLKEEFEKDEKDRFKVNKDDKINISGAVLLDGFHNVNSNNLYITQNNHLRSNFLIEFILVNSYIISEVLEPGQNSFSIKNSEINNLLSSIEISNLYYLKEQETIELKLKEAILKYELGKIKEFEDTSKEISLMNKLEKIKSKLRRNHKNKEAQNDFFNINTKLINLKWKKIEEVYNTLIETEKKIYRDKYKEQIKGLQLFGYIQNEGKINPNSTKVNAPIPYFSSKINNYNDIANNYSNISEIYKEYVKRKKEKFLEKNTENRNFAHIFTFPGDNFSSLYSQISTELGKHQKKYPNFGKVNSLDLLQKTDFIEKIIDEKYNLDLSNGEIPSNKNIIINFQNTNKILENIINKSYLKKIEISEIDKAILESITQNKEEYNMLAHILIRESYESGIPFRKLLKMLFLEFKNQLGGIKKINSFGDFQLRFFNLKGKYTLKKWPNTQQIQKAISYVDISDNSSSKLKEAINRRMMKYPEIVESDLKLIEEIRNLLNGINEKNRMERGQKIYQIFKKLFRFNGEEEVDIIGKTIQASLLLDKVKEHSLNLVSWYERSGTSINEINSKDYLQKSHRKLILAMNNKSPKSILEGTSENYILRILETLGENINQENYPKISLNHPFLKTIGLGSFGKYKYNKEILKQHLSFYKNKLAEIGKTEEKELTNEVIKEINNILKTNVEADSIYHLFKNSKIKEFLEKKGQEDVFLPTLEELNDKNNFRKKFYSYTKTPDGREKPKTYDIKTIVYGLMAGFVLFINGLGFGIRGIIKRRRKIKKTKKRNN